MSEVYASSNDRRCPFAVLMDVLVTSIVTLALLRFKEVPNGNFVALQRPVDRVTSASVRLLLNGAALDNCWRTKILYSTNLSFSPKLKPFLLLTWMVLLCFLLSMLNLRIAPRRPGRSKRDINLYGGYGLLWS